MVANSQGADVDGSTKKRDHAYPDERSNVVRLERELFTSGFRLVEDCREASITACRVMLPNIVGAQVDYGACKMFGTQRYLNTTLIACPHFHVHPSLLSRRSNHRRHIEDAEPIDDPFGSRVGDVPSDEDDLGLISVGPSPSGTNEMTAPSTPSGSVTNPNPPPVLVSAVLPTVGPLTTRTEVTAAKPCGPQNMSTFPSVAFWARNMVRSGAVVEVHRFQSGVGAARATHLESQRRQCSPNRGLTPATEA